MVLENFLVRVNLGISGLVFTAHSEGTEGNIRQTRKLVSASYTVADKEQFPRNLYSSS